MRQSFFDHLWRRRMTYCVSTLKQGAQSKTIYAQGQNLPIVQWSVCSALHQFLTGYVIGVWWLRSQRLRWVVTDERNWPLAPTLTCSFFSRKAAELAPEASRRQQRPASVQSSQASGISDSY